VKLYSAVQDQTIRFHLLHDQDLVRVQQHMINPETQKVVSRDRIRRGYQLDRDQLVIVTEAELESLEPKSSRDLLIKQFFNVSKINYQWYDRPYWLGPDGEPETYFALAEALAHNEAVGVVQWSMRNKRYTGVLCGEQNYLALITLRYAEEIVDASDLESPGGRQLEKQELDLAGKLIRALKANFKPSDFHDEYRARVEELIDAKRKGETIEVKPAEKKPRAKSLTDSLRASLRVVG
jgi:DNA end-binding protein Ku